MRSCVRNTYAACRTSPQGAHLYAFCALARIRALRRAHRNIWLDWDRTYTYALPTCATAARLFVPPAVSTCNAAACITRAHGAPRTRNLPHLCCLYLPAHLPHALPPAFTCLALCLPSTTCFGLCFACLHATFPCLAHFTLPGLPPPAFYLSLFPSLLPHCYFFCFLFFPTLPYPMPPPTPYNHLPSQPALFAFYHYYCLPTCLYLVSCLPATTFYLPACVLPALFFFG